MKTVVNIVINTIKNFKEIMVNNIGFHLFYSYVLLTLALYFYLSKRSHYSYHIRIPFFTVCLIVTKC